MSQNHLMVAVRVVVAAAPIRNSSAWRSASPWQQAGDYLPTQVVSGMLPFLWKRLRIVV
jgi:hypothetical protein